jgi:hypothetical protein
MGCTKPNGGYPCAVSWTDLAYGIGYFAHKTKPDKTNNNNNTNYEYFVTILCFPPGLLRQVKYAG